MGHLLAFRAAVGGKHPGNKAGRTTGTFPGIRRLILAVGTLLVASVSGSASYAQSDGSSERLRCRATYAVGAGGTGLNLSLTCASDSYRFILSSNVVAQGGALSGTWSESSRGISGNLEGRGGSGNFQVVANAPGFTANLSLATQGNRQSIVIRAAGQFRGANIALTRH